MNIRQSFLLALKALSASKLRALLTMLGIIIGVAAVIIIISLGDGMKAMINEQFEKMGSNLIQVYVRGRNSSRDVTDTDMYDLAEKYPAYIKTVSPNVTVTATLKVGNETYSSSVYGVNENYASIKALELDQGRFIRYIDVARMQDVCVIGSYVNQEAFDNDGCGKTLSLNGNRYTVVGVLTASADNASYGDDNTVYIPYTNAARLNSSSRITQYYVSATNENTNTQAKAIIENKLQKIFQDDNAYTVVSMSEVMGVMSTIQNTVMTVLVAIAAISLLVGGIGIMNIMLVTVSERTREIGIRRAIGAQRSSIVTQFLIEAAMLCGIGGVIGIGIGTMGTRVAGKLLVHMDIWPSVSITLAAFGLSVVLGILFGIYPAAKASKLQPVEALRAE